MPLSNASRIFRIYKIKKNFWGTLRIKVQYWRFLRINGYFIRAVNDATWSSLYDHVDVEEHSLPAAAYKVQEGMVR
jgi:hypothetical protein